MVKHSSVKLKQMMIQTILSVLFLLALQGCLLDRLEESKQQLCDNQITLTLENDISVAFSNPTLYDTDIQKILGEKPTKLYARGKDLYYEYLLTRKGDDISGTYDIPITFQFTKKDGRYKLAKVIVNKNIQDILSFALLKQVFNSGCKAKVNRKTVEVDLRGVDLTQLPKLKEIKQILGEPHYVNGNTFTYFYELNSSDTAEIIISYDKQMDRMSTIKMTYFRYVLDVDFDKYIASGKLKNWYNMVGLGFRVAFSP